MRMQLIPGLLSRREGPGDEAMRINGGIARSPITSKTSTVALEKAAFVVRAKPGENQVMTKVQECFLIGINGDL